MSTVTAEAPVLEASQRSDAESLRTSPHGFAGSLALFLTLAGVLPLTMVNWSAPQGTSTNMVLAGLIVLYCSYSLAELWYFGQPALLRLAVFVFSYIFMGLAPLAQVVSGHFPLYLPMTGAYSAAIITRALVAILFGIVVFDIAYRLARRSGRTLTISMQRQRAPGKRELSQRGIILLGVLGLVFTALLLARTGIRPFFQSWEARGNAEFGLSATANGYSASDKSLGALLRFMAQAPCLLSLFGFLYLRKNHMWRTSSVAASQFRWAFFAILAVVNIVINNPISNSRFWSGVVATTLGSLLLPLNRAKGFRWATALILIILLFAFTSLQVFRRTDSTGPISQGPRGDLVSSPTYSEFGMELAGLQWLQNNQHTDGYQLAGALLVFIPRTVWSGKPIDTGNLVVPYYNPAASLWTEGEVEAGLLGIFLYFALLGGISAAGDRRMARASPGDVAYAIIPVFAGFLIFVLRGSMLSVTGPAYVLALSVMFLSPPRWLRREAVPSWRLESQAIRD